MEGMNHVPPFGGGWGEDLEINLKFIEYHLARNNVFGSFKWNRNALVRK